MAVIPFRFKLKKVSRRQQLLLSALYDYLPDTPMRARFTHGVREAMTKVLGDPFEMRLESVEQEPASFFLRRLPASPVVAIVSLAPARGMILCEIDSTLAMMAIERLLGGNIESLSTPRPLTDIEQGVLQYVILEILAGIREHVGEEPRVHFRFERVAVSVEEASSFVEPDDQVALLSWRVSLGRYSGFVRMAFSEPFLDQALLEFESRGEVRTLERNYRDELLALFGAMRVPVWAEAGRTTVSPADLKGLEEGDVILLEQGEATLAAGAVSGHVVLRVGNGLVSGLDAEIVLSADRARASIIGVHKGV